MEQVLMGAAATAALGVMAWLAGLAIKRPFLYVKVGTALNVVAGTAMLIGIGMLSSAIIPSPFRIGAWVACGGAAAFFYLVTLGYLAAASLNAENEAKKNQLEGQQQARPPESGVQLPSHVHANHGAHDGSGTQDP